MINEQKVEVIEETLPQITPQQYRLKLSSKKGLVTKYKNNLRREKNDEAKEEWKSKLQKAEKELAKMSSIYEKLTNSNEVSPKKRKLKEDEDEDDNLSIDFNTSKKLFPQKKRISKKRVSFNSNATKIPRENWKKSKNVDFTDVDDFVENEFPEEDGLDIAGLKSLIQRYKKNLIINKNRKIARNTEEEILFHSTDNLEKKIKTAEKLLEKMQLAAKKKTPVSKNKQEARLLENVLVKVPVDKISLKKNQK